MSLRDRTRMWVVVWEASAVRIVCFVLGVLSIAASAAMVILGISTDDEGSATVSQLRTTAAAPINDTRASSYALAQIFGVVGIAWMVGAAAFAPGRSGSPGSPSMGPQGYANQYPGQQYSPPQPAPGQYPQT